MKKACLIGLVTTTLSTNCFSAVHTLAAPLSDGQQIQAQELTEVHTLSNSIRMLGTQTPLIQAYGLIILQQPNVKIDAMSSLTNHQTFAKTNVKEWLDEYNQEILNRNQEMMHFSTRFNSYYNNKLWALSHQTTLNEQEKNDFIRAVDQLQQQAQEVKEHLEQTNTSLHQFKEQVITDSKDLSERSSIAIKSLQGENGNVQQLQAEIKKIREDIQNNLATILNRPGEITKVSLNIGKELFKLVSTAAESKTFDLITLGSLSTEFMNASDSNTKQAALNVQQKQKELVAVIQQLAETQAQATEIICIEDQVTSFTDLLSRQITTFEKTVNDWKLLEDKLNQFKLTVHTNTNVTFTDLSKQLTQLKEWNDTINKQTKQFEDAILQVTVQ